MPPKLLVASLFEFALIAAGWLLLWRIALSRRARQTAAPPALPHWGISGYHFGMGTLIVVGGWLGAQIVAGLLARGFPVLATDKPLLVIVGGIAAQLCLIGSALAAGGWLRKAEPQASTSSPSHKPGPGLLTAAVVTCVVTIAVVYPVQYLWKELLTAFHLPTENQEMVEIFRQTDAPLRLIGLTCMAVVLAPLGEELVFRAGLFRFLRGRVPRAVALILPSLIFAGLHSALVTVAPLTALGIVFSLAYERTGRIAVPILAHALFNLHTVLFIVLGLVE